MYSSVLRISLQASLIWLYVDLGGIFGGAISDTPFASSAFRFKPGNLLYDNVPVENIML